MVAKESYTVPELHSSFLLNNKNYSISNLGIYAQHLMSCGEDFEIEIGNFILDWLNDKPYVVVHTSGSTGKPKPIKILKEHMVNSAKATGAFFKVEAGTNALLCLPVKYIAGKMMLVRAMILGWKLDCVSPKSNPLDSVYKQYDFCAMVPFQLDNSINRLHLLKKLIVGGSEIPGYLIALIQDIETKIYETYGMTETVTHIAARRVNSKKKAFKDCYFKSLPQVTLSVDERNCLVIKAPMISNDIVVTNDIVSLVSYKKFKWKGRIDNVINSGGVKLHPEEIERKLKVVIRERFFISALEHESLGQQLILVIEDPSNMAVADAFFDKIKNVEGISNFEIPKQIFLMETFIETTSGKIHRTKNLELIKISS